MALLFGFCLPSALQGLLLQRGFSQAVPYLLVLFCYSVLAPFEQRGTNW